VPDIIAGNWSIAFAGRENCQRFLPSLSHLADFQTKILVPSQLPADLKLRMMQPSKAALQRFVA